MHKNSPLGARLILLSIALMLLTSLTVMTYYIVEIGTDRLPNQIVRFLVTCVLCREIYRRKSWARWLTLLLCCAAVYVAIGPIAEYGVMNIAGLTMASYVAIIVLLLFGPGVGEYFSVQDEGVDELEGPKDS